MGNLRRERYRWNRIDRIVILKSRAIAAGAASHRVVIIPYHLINRALPAFIYLQAAGNERKWIESCSTRLIVIENFASSESYRGDLQTSLISCAEMTCHARREFSVPLLQYFLSFEYF